MWKLWGERATSTIPKSNRCKKNTAIRRNGRLCSRLLERGNSRAVTELKNWPTRGVEQELRHSWVLLSVKRRVALVVHHMAIGILVEEKV